MLSNLEQPHCLSGPLLVVQCRFVEHNGRLLSFCTCTGSILSVEMWLFLVEPQIRLILVFRMFRVLLNSLQTLLGEFQRNVTQNASKVLLSFSTGPKIDGDIIFLLFQPAFMQLDHNSWLPKEWLGGEYYLKRRKLFHKQKTLWWFKVKLKNIL